MLMHTCVDGREAPMLPRDCDACMKASHAVALQGVAEMNRRYDDLRTGYREWIAKADAALAEVARLREALEHVLVMTDAWKGGATAPTIARVTIEDIARAALGRTTT